LMAKTMRTYHRGEWRRLRKEKTTRQEDQWSKGCWGLTTGNPGEHYLDIRTAEMGCNLVDTYSSHAEWKEAWHLRHSSLWSVTNTGLRIRLGSNWNSAINYDLMFLRCYSNSRHLRFKRISAFCNLGEIEGTLRDPCEEQLPSKRSGSPCLTSSHAEKKIPPKV
jgi:hypothetical protein